MSKLTPNLGLHIWEKPKDNKEKFNYIKSVAENFEKIDESYKEAVDKFTEPLSYKGEVKTYKDLPSENNKNGDIYNVTSENKNYIWNGTDWIEYSSTLDLTYLEDNTKTLQTTEVSEELEINDCAGANAKLDIVSGKSWQETREGKNIAKINEQYWELTNNNTIKNKGRNEAANLTKFEVKEGQTVNLYLKMLSKPSQSTTFTYYIDNVVKSAYNFNNIQFFDLRKIYKQTFVAEKDCTIKYTMWGNADSETFEFQFWASINQELEEYEPYGVMPSPDYPSEIRNVGDNINLFDKDNAHFVKNLGLSANNSFFERSDQKLLVLPIQGKKYFTISWTKTTGNSRYYGFSNEIPVDVNSKHLGRYEFVKDTEKGEIIREITNNNNYEYLLIAFTTSDNLDDLKIEPYLTPTPYTPFGCGSVDFKVENRNIAKIETGQYWELTSNNNIKGLAVNNTGQDFVKEIQLKQGQTLYFYAKKIVNNSGNDAVLGFYKDNIAINSYNINIGRQELNTLISKSFTATEDCIVSFKSWATGVGFENLEFQFWAEIDTTNLSNDYLPHQEQIVSFPLSKGQVLHEGDYLADDGVHQNRKTKIFDGTENWAFQDTMADRGFNLISINITDIKRKSNFYDDSEMCLSSIAKYSRRPADITSVNMFTNWDTSNLVYFTTYMNLDEWKEYIKAQYEEGNPAKLEYALAKEEVIPYTLEQQEAYNKLQNLLLYESYTKITCLDEMKLDIQATYYFDNEINNTYAKRIDSIEERLRQLEKLVSSQSEVIE